MLGILGGDDIVRLLLGDNGGVNLKKWYQSQVLIQEERGEEAMPPRKNQTASLAGDGGHLRKGTSHLNKW